MPVKEGEHCGAIAQMFLQAAGMLTGAVIMLIIAMYEHDLKDALVGAF